MPSSSSSASWSNVSTPSPGSLTPATTPGSEQLPPPYKTRYPVPPSVKTPYNPEDALTDLPAISYALELFLSSQMVESEDFCHRSDKEKERLYFATGYGLIQCVKGLMSYADEDLLSALGHAKHGNLIASQHRKKATLFGSRLAGFVANTISSTSNAGIIGFIKGMTDVERHAELVYAESLFEKALLGIVYSGDWLAFIKEALNMRSTITIYKHLGLYIEHMDSLAAQSQSSSKDGSPVVDTSIDPHFRSGVYLGLGISNIVMSLMPSRLLTIVELFGYKGDRKLGLDLLMKVGGWDGERDEPRISEEQEGVRRPVADMVLLIFHLVVSSFTFDGVDISIAAKILKWNLKRFPNGVFFLFGAGRLALCRSQPLEAIEYYTRAMESQRQYRNLHHISFWEIAIARLALWDIQGSLVCWRDLVKEATWSKSIYSYGMAVCLLEIGGEKEKEEARQMMEKVPNLRQKIAGKSIPLEKYVARKARKYLSQGQRLSLAGLELAYLFLGIAHAPRHVIITKMLPEAHNVLGQLGYAPCAGASAGTSSTNKSEKERKEIEKKWHGGKGGYWDDYCLARFLEGVCLRYVAYPDPDAVLDPNEVISILREEAANGATKAFQDVFEYGPKIELDHHIVYHAHYELGRLLACQGTLSDIRYFSIFALLSTSFIHVSSACYDAASLEVSRR
ncbi:hypothetical protein AX16_001844 [Volvariella volvacea WC 439]|nr:hypothetical protein AX16_001844 [Volvariella volvacea WC 439]